MALHTPSNSQDNQSPRASSEALILDAVKVVIQDVNEILGKLWCGEAGHTQDTCWNLSGCHLCATQPGKALMNNGANLRAIRRVAPSEVHSTSGSSQDL